MSDQSQQNEPENIQEKLNPTNSITNKSIGTILGCFCGDVLGTPVEGLSRQKILSMAKTEGDTKLRNFIPGQHMGLYHLPPRYGMYTDDTNSTLALAYSLTQAKKLNPTLTAHMYGRFWMQEPRRGYPDSAQAVMAQILTGTPITCVDSVWLALTIRKTGTACFPDGSFANGGLMRISPIGIAFRNATLDQLYEATKWAIISSHVHPEAIDAAFVQSHGIQILLPLTDPSQITPAQFVDRLIAVSRNDNVKTKLQAVKDFLEQMNSANPPDLVTTLRSLGSGFQIKATEALGCSLWAFVTNWNSPEECLIDAVSYGGDTDTIAAIAGALCGALHGTEWIPKRWFDNLENGDYGRDFAIKVAIELAALDLKEVAQETPEGTCELLFGLTRQKLKKLS